MKNHIHRNSSRELLQALDGIEELCDFLDVKFVFPIHATRPPIDEALEANEQVNSKKWRWKKYNSGESRALAGAASINQGGTSELRKELEYQRKTVADKESLSEFSATAINAYERPEESISSNPSRLLGSSREIELITIEPSECVVEPIEEDQPRIRSNQGSDSSSSSKTSQRSELSQ